MLSRGTFRSFSTLNAPAISKLGAGRRLTRLTVFLLHRYG